MKDMRFIGYIILSMLAGVYTAKAQTVPKAPEGEQVLFALSLIHI